MTPDVMDHPGFIYQGYIKRKITKRFTMKEWNRFNKTLVKKVGEKEYYLDMQQLFCKKYQIILTDYKTKREKTIHILKKFNGKNFDKGMKIFNDGLNAMLKELDSFTSGLGDGSAKTTTKNLNALVGKPKAPANIWGKKKTNNNEIWGIKKKSTRSNIGFFVSPPVEKKKRRKKKNPGKTKSHMDTIWGNKK